MRTESDISFGLRRVEPHPGLEPLAVFIDQRQECHGRLADFGCAHHDGVKKPLGRRIEKLRSVQGLQSLGFIRRKTRTFHYYLYPPNTARENRLSLVCAPRFEARSHTPDALDGRRKCGSRGVRG